ncbi:MAG TPA: alanine racemase [Gemmatimonadales bacterium]|nr:alanine racemase [Gemmatimonadales bacterium]
MSIPDETVRAWAEIDLNALVANARTVGGISGARLLPMVKANGYGLGAPMVARALEAVDPWGFGVATVEEGTSLRAAGILRPILVFAPLHPSLISRYLAQDLRPTISDLAALDAWIAEGSNRFHVEVDTGMSRTGFRWDDQSGWQNRLRSAPGLEGAFTHFYAAESDSKSVDTQWERLQQVVASLSRKGILVHAANSAAALRGPAYAGDLVRPGIFLYGGDAGGPVPEPVVKLRTRVVATRRIKAGDTVSYGGTWTAPVETLIATLGIGYADGVPRSLSNSGVVEVRGKLATVVGRVTMDYTMVSCESPCAVGDIATVYGGLVSLDQQAERARTISYELLTSIGARLPRCYV